MKNFWKQLKIWFYEGLLFAIATLLIVFLSITTNNANETAESTSYKPMEGIVTPITISVGEQIFYKLAPGEYLEIRASIHQESELEVFSEHADVVIDVYDDACECWHNHDEGATGDSEFHFFDVNGDYFFRISEYAWNEGVIFISLSGY